MGIRILVTILSAALLGGAGWASWQGWGAVDRDAGPQSVRTGSAGTGGLGRIRVK